MGGTMRTIGVTWVFGAANFFHLWHTCQSKERLVKFNLEPISLLYHEKHFDRHRRLKAFEGSPSDKLPIISYHPFSTGIYSSVVELDLVDNLGNWSSDFLYNSVVEDHNKLVSNYNSMRHLSRFELSHRRNFDTDSTDASNNRKLQQNINNIRGGLPPIVETINNEQLNGGLYKEFQSAPLSQGYGTHYATVW